MPVQMRFNVDVKLSSRVLRALDGIKYGVANRVVKGAVAKQARKTAKDEKADAPRGPTGLLKKAMGTRYKSYQQRTVWVYAVGPRAGVKGTNPATGRNVVPTYYSHLAEGGRRAVRAVRAKALRFAVFGGNSGSKRGRKFSHWVVTPRVGPAKGFYFARHAVPTLYGRRAELERDILAGIVREAAKAAAKGGSIYTP